MRNPISREQLDRRELLRWWALGAAILTAGSLEGWYTSTTGNRRNWARRAGGGYRCLTLGLASAAAWVRLLVALFPQLWQSERATGWAPLSGKWAKRLVMGLIYALVACSLLLLLLAPVF